MLLTEFHQLQVGDTVVTPSAGTTTIRWIQQAYDLTDAHEAPNVLGKPVLSDDRLLVDHTLVPITIAVQLDVITIDDVPHTIHEDDPVGVASIMKPVQYSEDDIEIKHIELLYAANITYRTPAMDEDDFDAQRQLVRKLEPTHGLKMSDLLMDHLREFFHDEAVVDLVFDHNFHARANAFDDAIAARKSAKEAMLADAPAADAEFIDYLIEPLDDFITTFDLKPKGA